MSGDGLDDAASAFNADIASETPSAKGPGPKPDITEGPPERLFGEVGDLEVDEDSPERAPGDDEPPPRTKKDEDEEDEEVDDAEEEEEEESDDDEDAAFYAQEVQVMVDGKEKSVKLREALDGYVRQETFHQRMNDVEEAKKVIRDTAKDVVQNYQYAENLVKEIEAHLHALVPPEPNWDEEFKKNPVRAREMQRYYEQVKGFRIALHDRIREARGNQAASNTTQLKAYVEEEAKKFSMANSKNWGADPARKGKDLQAMRRTALSHGFTEEELSQVYDSRMLQVLLKASKYDRMMASKPQPVNKQTTVKTVPSTGGRPKAKQATRGFSSAMKTLNQTGHLEDAAKVFDHILAGENRR